MNAQISEKTEDFFHGRATGDRFANRAARPGLRSERAYCAGGTSPKPGMRGQFGARCGHNRPWLPAVAHSAFPSMTIHRITYCMGKSFLATFPHSPRKSRSEMAPWGGLKSACTFVNKCFETRNNPDRWQVWGDTVLGEAAVEAATIGELCRKSTSKRQFSPHFCSLSTMKRFERAEEKIYFSLLIISLSGRSGDHCCYFDFSEPGKRMISFSTAAAVIVRITLPSILTKAN